MNLVSGSEVLVLMEKVRANPIVYRKLLLCAPFISHKLLLHIAGFSRRVPVSTIVFTSPETAQELSAVNLSGPIRIVSVRRIHAKVYIACGKDDRNSLAIMGSFNLTHFGLARNFELGIKITGADCQERNLIKRAEQTLTTILLKKERCNENNQRFLLYEGRFPDLSLGTG